MTTQEMHDGIVAWFTRPDAVLGRQDSGFACVYRGDSNPESNIRCGIGCMIPNKLYDPDMENTSIIPLLEDRDFDFPGLVEHFGSVNRSYMMEVQHAHDNLQFVEGVAEFLDKLKYIAEDFGLTHKVEA